MSIVTQSVLNPSLDLNYRFSFSHPHLLKTYGFSPPNNANQQSPNVLNQIFFESSDVTLQKLVAKRRPNKLFTEPDILAILRGLCSVLAYLQSKGVNHGDIEPSAVFFDAAKGCFKINDQELLRGKNSGFYFLKQKKKFTFLAPELIEDYRRNDVVAQTIPNFKADVFALGLTVMEAATLLPSQEIYDYEKGMMIKADSVDERLIFIKNHYSGELTHVLRMMLEYDPDVRPDCLELYEIINVPKEKIKEEKIVDYNAALKENPSVSKPYKTRSMYASQEILPRSEQQVYENSYLHKENIDQKPRITKELSKSIYFEDQKKLQNQNFKQTNNTMKTFAMTQNLNEKKIPQANYFKAQAVPNNMVFMNNNYAQQSEPMTNYENYMVNQNPGMSPEKRNHVINNGVTPPQKKFALGLRTAGPKNENTFENKRYQTTLKETENLPQSFNNYPPSVDANPSAMNPNLYKNNTNFSYQNFNVNASLDNLPSNYQTLNYQNNQPASQQPSPANLQPTNVNYTQNTNTLQNQNIASYYQNAKVVYNSNELDKMSQNNDQRVNVFSEMMRKNINPNFYNLEPNQNLTQNIINNRTSLIANQNSNLSTINNIGNFSGNPNNGNVNNNSQKTSNVYTNIIDKNKKLEKRIDEILKKSQSLTQALNMQGRTYQN